MSDWTAKARDLAHNLSLPARRNEPICFLIGAGGSLSSGAPTTSTVLEAFDRAFGGRLSDMDPAERRRAIDRFAESEKRATLEPAFSQIAPYVGYRCLAAMGRERRVIVLNLNWDLAIEHACARIGVPTESISLDEGEADLERVLLQTDPGVSVIHLHGQFDRDVRLRYGTLETLSFPDAIGELLRAQALAHTTIVLGASLQDDADVHELLSTLGRERHGPLEQRPLWVFMRGAEPSPTVRAAINELLGSRESEFNWATGEDLDSDRLLVQLREGEIVADRGKDASYEELRKRSAGLALRSLTESVWPRPSLLRDALDEPIVALVGEAGLGKSIVAHLLAFWRTLWGERDGIVHALRGTSPSVIALGTAAGVPEGSGQLVIEDPFGQESTDSNPPFVPALAELARRHDAPGVILTSRLYNWHRGFGEEDPTFLPEHAIGDPDPMAWYSMEDLLSHLRAKGPLALAEHEEKVRERELNTPRRIDLRDAGFTPRADDPGNTRDKANLLCGLFERENRRAMALAVVLARLQELSEEPQTESSLFALAGEIEQGPAWRRARSMLFAYKMDGAARVKLLHSTDRAAVDSFLTVHQGELEPALLDLGPSGRWAVQALSVWRALQAAREREDWSIAEVSEDVRRAWAGPLIVQSTEHSPERGWETITALLEQASVDFWTLCEIVYETLRLWQILKDPADRADAFIDRLLEDRERMGAYALLEAMLYLQSVTPGELWAPLERAVIRMARAPGNDLELALIFDGLLWRPPAVGEDSKRRLFTALLDACAQHPGLHGAYRLACAYHEPGASFLAEQQGLADPAAHGTPLNDEEAAQAARVVRFHFVHQSRARVALARRPFEGGTIDYLFQTLYRRPLQDARGERLTALVEQLAAHEQHAGWGVHLALNIGNTQGTFDQHQLDRIAAAIPPRTDDGLIAAIFTYQLPGQLGAEVTGWFQADPRRRDAALDRLRDGFRFDGWTVKAPRFRFVRDLGVLWTLLGCDWPRLNRQAEVPTSEPAELILGYEAAAERAISDRGADRHIVALLLERARAGDLRDFDAAARQRAGEDPFLASLVSTAATLAPRAEDQQELL